MKNIDEHQEIKNSLDKDVFSRYQFKSQKNKIMEKANELSQVPKRKN
jgi:hypothetical protein